MLSDCVKIIWDFRCCVVNKLSFDLYQLNDNINIEIDAYYVGNQPYQQISPISCASLHHDKTYSTLLNYTLITQTYINLNTTFNQLTLS